MKFNSVIFTLKTDSGISNVTRFLVLLRMVVVAFQFLAKVKHSRILQSPIFLVYYYSLFLIEGWISVIRSNQGASVIILNFFLFWEREVRACGVKRYLFPKRSILASINFKLNKSFI